MKILGLCEPEAGVGYVALLHVFESEAFRKVSGFQFLGCIHKLFPALFRRIWPLPHGGAEGAKIPVLHALFTGAIDVHERSVKWIA